MTGMNRWCVHFDRSISFVSLFLIFIIMCDWERWLVNNYYISILPVTIEAGTCHNLDLSLGISPSSKRLKNNDYSGGYSFGCMASLACKIPKERGTMVLLFAFLLVAISFMGGYFFLPCIGTSHINILSLFNLFVSIKCFAN